MTRPRTCSTCAAYALKTSGVEGECRRHAPRVGDPDHWHPEIKPDHWCLEWLPAAERPADGGAQS